MNARVEPLADGDETRWLGIEELLLVVRAVMLAADRWKEDRDRLPLPLHPRGRALLVDRVPRRVQVVVGNGERTVDPAAVGTAWEVR